MFYLTIGSQNLDFWVKIMDGEVDLAVYGYHSLFALIDLFFMPGFIRRVEEVEGLDELLPPESGWRRWLGRYIMRALSSRKGRYLFGSPSQRRGDNYVG